MEVMMHFDFLICSERSGSNLMTKILDAHPDICGPFPRHAMNCFLNNYHNYGDINTAANWEALVNDMAAFMNSGFSIWQTEVSAEMIFENVKIHSLAEILRYIYEHEAVANNKKRVFVKENHAYRYLPFTLNHFPGAKYVFVVRDPREMALCWKENTVYGGVKAATRVWLEDQRAGLMAFGGLKDLNRIIIVRFEDLITHTATAVQRVCDFLEIAYVEEMLRFHAKDVVKANARLAITGGWDDLAKPNIKDNCSNYKSRLSEVEIKYIEHLCREEMDYFGYPPDFPLEPDLKALEDQMPDEAAIVDPADLAARRKLRVKFHTAINTIQNRKMY